MFLRIIHYLLGFLSGALIVGGFITRIWSGSWGGDGFCVVIGSILTLVTLIVSSAHKDGNL